MRPHHRFVAGLALLVGSAAIASAQTRTLSSTTPKIRRVSQASMTLQAGGSATVLTIDGSGFGAVTGLELTMSSRPVTAVKGTLRPVADSRLGVVLSATTGAPAGAYQLTLLAGRLRLPVPVAISVAAPSTGGTPLIPPPPPPSTMLLPPPPPPTVPKPDLTISTMAVQPRSGPGATGLELVVEIRNLGGAATSPLPSGQTAVASYYDLRCTMNGVLIDSPSRRLTAPSGQVVFYNGADYPVSLSYLQVARWQIPLPANLSAGQKTVKCAVDPAVPPGPRFDELDESNNGATYLFAVPDP